MSNERKIHTFQESSQPARARETMVSQPKDLVQKSSGPGRGSANPSAPSASSVFITPSQAAPQASVQPQSSGSDSK